MRGCEWVIIELLFEHGANYTYVAATKRINETDHKRKILYDMPSWKIAAAVYTCIIIADVSE